MLLCSLVYSCRRDAGMEAFPILNEPRMLRGLLSAVVQVWGQMKLLTC